VNTAAKSDLINEAPNCFLYTRHTHRRSFLRVPRKVRIARFTESCRDFAMGRVLGQDRRSQSTQRREVAVGADQHKTRLADIAQHFGLSTATVSRVINGKPGVSSTARRQVLAALDVLGYKRPERSSQRRQGLIGLIIPELTNPIFPAFAQAMEI